MPNAPSDEDLLIAFAKSNDEQAFRCIAERYSGLIFHTALRALNDRMLAEDVAQRVLGVLAKKANQVARGAAPLPSWLHRTTVLEAKTMRRSESRHERKKTAVMHAPTESPDHREDDWKDALPHLDAVIDSLPEGERHVILLHFVNGLTFPEIARRVGKSTAAVQKQSSRTLELLQQKLSRRGVALSIGVLAAGLSTEMAKAAPVILIPSAGTLASLGKTTTGIVVKKSTLVAVSATVLLCGIPLARQQATLNQLEARLAGASMVATSASTTRSGTRSPAAGMSIIKSLARDLKMQNQDLPRYLSALDHIESLPNVDLIRMAQETVGSSLPFLDQEVLFARLLDTLANRDYELTLTTLLEKIPISYLGESDSAWNLFAGCLSNWAKKEGSGALAWFNSHLDVIDAIPIREGPGADYLVNRIRTGLADGMMESAPAEVTGVLRPLSHEDREIAFQSIAERMDPFPKESIPGFVQSVRELLSAPASSVAISRLLSRRTPVGQGSLPYEPVDELLDSMEFTSLETNAIVLSAGSRIIRSHGNREEGIRQFREWLATRFREGIDLKIGSVLGRRVNDESYNIMLNRGTAGLGDEAVTGFLTELAAGPMIEHSDVEKIEKIAASIANRDFVRSLVDKIKENTHE
jgi:RNA polymerase sigma factor (sigma-70 family)